MVTPSTNHPAHTTSMLSSSKFPNDQDDDSIHSTLTTTSGPSSITPCYNYSNYGVWLRKQFPGIITIKDSFLVHSILKIRSLDDLSLYNEFTPEEWKEYLHNSYHVWLKTIIELVIIWTVTIDVYNDVPYSDYLKIRQELLPVLQKIYGDTKPKPPSPPPYQPISPIVKEFEQEKAKEKERSKSMRSSKTYRTTPPAYHDPLDKIASKEKSVLGSKKSKKDSDGFPCTVYTCQEADLNSLKSSRSLKSDGPSLSSQSIQLPKKLKVENLSLKSYKSSLNEHDYNGGDSIHSSSSSSTRSLRMKPAKIRPKFEKVKWDGMNTTFRSFKRAIEGHLLQVGAGYLTEDSFIQLYFQMGQEYLKSKHFWEKYQISIPQALFDQSYLYGILVSATKDLQNKIIIKYEKNQDGILAWHDLKKDYAYDGSKELRVEQLETIVQRPFSNKDFGGMQSYIDHFQAYIGELESIAPSEYSDSRKKRMLLNNIRNAEGVAHLIQKCRDDDSMTYEDCAAYLRKYAFLIDQSN